MFYLIKSILDESCGGYDLSTFMVMKSKSIEPLQKEVKRLFDEAVKEMDDDGLVNNCSKEAFDGGEGVFDENILSIYTLFPTPGMERQTIDYAIVTDENVKEV